MEKILPLVIELKGDCSGITTTLIERTANKALFRRSDGIWECFFIKKSNWEFKNGHWEKIDGWTERYPKTKNFGKIAWCGRESVIRKRYSEMEEAMCHF